MKTEIPKIEKEPEVVIYQGGKKWGIRADSLPNGDYKVLSTSYRVLQRNGITDNTKTLSFVQFTVMVQDEPTLVYMRDTQFDIIEKSRIRPSYPINGDNVYLRVHPSLKFDGASVYLASFPSEE